MTRSMAEGLKAIPEESEDKNRGIGGQAQIATLLASDRDIPMKDLVYLMLLPVMHNMTCQKREHFTIDQSNVT